MMAFGMNGAATDSRRCAAWLIGWATLAIGVATALPVAGQQQAPASGPALTAPADADEEATAERRTEKTPAVPQATEVAKEAVDAAKETAVSAGGVKKLLAVLALIVVPIILGNWLAATLRMPDHGWKFALGIGSLAAAALVIATGEIKLGPDLSGGITLIYELADASDLAGPAAKDAPAGEEEADRDAGGGAFAGDEKIGALIKALTERVDPSGTKEVSIRKYGEGQIEIIIPNAEKTDLEYIERRIYTAGALEFRITANERFAKHRNLIELARRLPAGENVASLEDGTPVARWVAFDPREFGTVEDAQQRGLVTRQSGDTPQALVLVDDALDVTGDYLRSASPGFDETGRPEVEFVFNERGAQLFGLLTGNHLPNPSGERYSLGILLDNRLLSAPTIESKITSRGRISGGSMDEKEVEFLVGILNAGSLPAALNKDPISRNQISPTIGKETVRKGKIALTVSLGVVALFMLWYYRFAGFLACLGLAANMVLILGVMVLIKGAFTLPGLAGLVLTVGMSVDANVLINERIRDELNRGAALRMAIRNGFSRAWVTIFDSNVTNLIVAAVIYKIAPDNVKGFGVTLFIGILMSVFSAVFLVRILFDIAERKGWMKQLRMRQFVGETHFDFLGVRKACIAGSLLIIGVGLAAAVARKSDLFDIDFTGGSSVTFVLDDDGQMDFAEVLAKLEQSALAEKNLSLVEIGDTRSQYTVTTIDDDVKEVEKILQETFGEKLKTYRVEVDEVRPLTSMSLRRRTDALAWRGPLGPLGAVSLLQADGAASAAPADESSQPAKEPAAEATEAGSGDAATTATTEAAATAPAAGKFAGGSAANIRFSLGDAPAAGGKSEAQAGGINHATLEQLVGDALKEAGYGDVAFQLSNPGYQPGSIRTFPEWTVTVALPADKAQPVFEKLSSRLSAEPVFPLSNKIGGRVAGRMAGDAIAATIFSLAGITAYVWFRFHRAVYGLAAVAALIHDVLVALGFVALSSYFVGGLGPLADALMIDKFQVGLVLVAAFLTIIGYSLNDTIVVFDRIREVKGKAPRLTAKMINDSVNQTLARTLLTSFTTLMTIIVLYIFAGEGIHGFAYAMLVGVIAGSYSTIFIANPILLWLSERAEQGTTQSAAPR